MLITLAVQLMDILLLLLEWSSLCVRRRDLVDVQSEESHAGAEEKH